MKRLDDRGQAIQIGAVLLFGIAVIWFSIYSATIIPQENRQIEFNHFQEVKDDMKQVRAAIQNVGGTGTTQSQTVTLGTTYPARIIGMNPPQPSGSLRTAAEGQIQFNRAFDVKGICGYTGSARTITYESGYNELEAQTVEYDNSAVVVNGTDEYAVLSGQTLIEGTTIQISPLNASLLKSGSERASLEFKGGPANGSVQTVNSDLVITLPTRLPASVWETNDKLFGDVANVKSVEPAGNADNAVNVTLEPDTYTVSCRAVGIGSYPDSGAANPPGIDTGYGKGTTQTYNPNGDNSDVLATKGGVLKGIVNASKVNVTQPSFAATRSNDGTLSKSSRYLRVGFFIQNKSVGTTDYQKYHFSLGDPSGLQYAATKDGVDWKEQRVYLISETDGENPKEVISGVEIKESALNDWLLNNEELDLLDENNYRQPNKVSSELADVRSYLNNDEKVRLQIVENHGRVTFNVTG